MPISAAFSTCAGVPPMISASAPAAIEHATDLALTADLGAADRRVLLVDRADCGAGGEQEVDVPSSSVVGHAEPDGDIEAGQQG